MILGLTKLPIHLLQLRKLLPLLAGNWLHPSFAAAAMRLLSLAEQHGAWLREM